MSLLGAAVAAPIGLLLGLLVPGLIARVPEPDEPADDKVPYAVIAARPGLLWQAAFGCGLIAGLIGAALGQDWSLLFLLPLVPVGFALGLIDWRTRLLPTRIIAPTYVVLVPLVVLAALLAGDPRLLIGAAVGWLVMGGYYLLMWVIYPPGVGYGDVRLSGILGIVLGYLGWGPLALGSFAGLLLGGLGSLVLVALRLIDKQENPFGPWMLIGALVGIILGPAFGTWAWGDLAG